MTQPGERRIRGKISEDFVKQYILKTYKYQFVDSNYTTKLGEIDLIFKSKKEELLIFVEVRSLSFESYISPEETVSAQKKKKIIRTAKMFLFEKYQTIDIASQFDVAAVLFVSETIAEIDYFEDAFGENW